MPKPVLLLVTASTRPGRIGPSVTQWLRDAAEAHGAFDVRVADLAEVGLPLLDEPNHPRLQRYVSPKVWAWSETVDAADAVVFVSPEYDHMLPASLLNAIQTISPEWAYKPAGLATYGGVSAGLRSAETIRQVVGGLKMFVVQEAVSVPFVFPMIDEQKVLHPNDVMENAAKAMFTELDRVQVALAGLRAEQRVQEHRRPA